MSLSQSRKLSSSGSICDPPDGHELHDMCTAESRRSTDTPKAHLLMQDQTLIDPCQTRAHSQASDLLEESPRLNWSRSILSWALQLACWIFGLAFYVAIIIVLNHFNHHSVPDWPHGIQLSAIINLLGRFGDILLLVPVASAVGQVRWIRTRSWRGLDEFCAIDAASRGAWGSFLLLVGRFGGLLASFGAIITVLALLTGTFVQQTVRTSSHYTSNTTARIPVATILDSQNDFQYSDQPDVSSTGVDPTMIAATYAGLFSSAKAPFKVTADCPTGNCSWSSFQTLAVCNTCVNLTSELSRITVTAPQSVLTNSYMLPNQFALSSEFPTTKQGVTNWNRPVLNVTYTRYPDNFLYEPSVFYDSSGSSRAFDANGSVILGVIAIGLSPDGLPSQPEGSEADLQGWPDAAPVAYECLLQFCVHLINATFVNGALVESVNATYVDQSVRATGDSGYSIVPSGQPFLPDEKFTVTDTSLNGLSSWLASFLAVGNGTVQRFPHTYFTTAQAGTMFSVMNSSWTGFPDAMDNVASSLTQALRQLPQQPTHALGEAYLESISFEVRWLWLLYPLTIAFMGLALLILVIRDTKKQGQYPWKDSLLAAMLHAIDARSHNLGSTSRLTEMEQFAYGFMTRVEYNEGSQERYMALRPRDA